jgi:uncharacterized protein
MQLRDGQLVLSPTDVTKHVACPHITTLDLAVLAGGLERPEEGVDEQLALIFAKGLEHEHGYLTSLCEQGRQVVEIADEPSITLAEREARTLQAMRDGAEVIYQAVLFDGAWVGYADFLLRNDERASPVLGAWSYDIADTKLARRLKVAALLQMATYAVRLEQLQGIAPDRLVVVTGDDQQHPWRLVDVDSYARRVRERLSLAVEQRPPTAPVPVAYCAQCRWQPTCSAQWAADDDLSLVAGMRTDQRARLIEAGITTMTALAGAADHDVAGPLSRLTRDRLRAQARLQVQERETGAAAYQLLPAAPGQGLQLLPEPDPGDVYLDFEGDPFAQDGEGREYLAGVWTRDGDFLDWWAHDAARERSMVGELLAWLLRRWHDHPGMHVYHYAMYEQTALKRLTARYATAESELDQLLRGERFVDLYAVVRQGVQLSKPSYSIKQVEDFYWGHTRTGGQDEVTDALSSVVEYERWVAGRRSDDSILDRLRSYNREDVRSTHALHGWLEDLRDELGRTGAALVRAVGKPVAEAADTELIAKENALAQRLVAAGHELLAGCVGWHRREDKQGWWEYYRTDAMSEEELVEDGATLGGVGPPEQVGEVKRSFVWRYRFPPQDGRVRVGGGIDDARTHEPVGTVADIDVEQGWIEVKRLKVTPPATPAGLVQNGHVPNVVLRESLLRLGELALARGETTGGLPVLDRSVPAGMEPRAGEPPADTVRRVGRGLDGQVLAVQGPPGAGKTYAGSHLIADLLDAGLRVGVTAQSHRVIADLMAGTDRPGLRKVSDPDQIPDEPDPADPIALTTKNADVVEALTSGAVRLVGGTAWLWAREDMAGLVDVLLIDEAGQFSLANALAVAQGATRGVVLLGDPQQLAQPTTATHPYGAGISVLEHLLDGNTTITSEQGVFLDRTWRMHPGITEFVSGMSYDGRLLSVPDLERQEVLGVPGLEGSGVRWVPVEHEGYSADNPVEAEVVTGLVGRLLGGRWVDVKGRERPVTPEDVLVVAPYNAHVARLRAALPEAVAVGTVDKFQGREAAVVIYSMASSSAEEAPRGVGFLYDTHRLNVAVSRARALAVVVGNPALLQAPVSSPEQLRSVNALCRFVDLARSVPVTRPAARGADLGPVEASYVAMALPGLGR